MRDKCDVLQGIIAVLWFISATTLGDFLQYVPIATAIYGVIALLSIVVVLLRENKGWDIGGIISAVVSVALTVFGLMIAFPMLKGGWEIFYYLGWYSMYTLIAIPLKIILGIVMALEAFDVIKPL